MGEQGFRVDEEALASYAHQAPGLAQELSQVGGDALQPREQRPLGRVPASLAENLRSWVCCLDCWRRVHSKSSPSSLPHFANAYCSTYAAMQWD